MKTVYQNYALQNPGADPYTAPLLRLGLIDVRSYHLEDYAGII